MSDPIEIRVVEDVAGFERLRQVWREILPQCRPNFVFMTWEWCYTWWQHFSDDRNLFILVLYQNNEPIGIVPLMRHVRRVGVHHYQRHLHFIGFRYEQRWNDWIDIPSTDKAAAIPAVMRFLARRQHLWDVIDLWDLLEDSDTLPLLEKAAQELDLPFSSKRINVSPYVDTSGNWEEYYQNTVQLDVQKGLSWKVPRLMRRGPIEVRWPDHQNIKTHLTALFDFRHRRQAERSQVNMFDEQVYQDFYFALIDRFPLAQLDCPLLTVGGVPAAAHFGFRYGGKLYWCTPGFDPTMKAYSPGAILLQRLLQQCFGDSTIGDFDFLRGNEPYKYDWANGERHIRRIQITSPYASGLRGKFFRRLPTSLRRMQTLLPSGRSDQ